MLVVNKLEVRQRELMLQQLAELVLYGLGPLAHEHDELVNGPRQTARGPEDRTRRFPRKASAHRTEPYLPSVPYALIQLVVSLYNMVKYNVHRFILLQMYKQYLK